MRYAASLAEDNKLDEASKIVKGVYEKSVAYGIVHHQSGMVLISLLEDQKKFEESVAVADKLLSTAGEGLKPQYLLAKARGLYLQNKKEDAAKVADEIIEKHENTQESEKARGLKALIN